MDGIDLEQALKHDQAIKGHPSEPDGPHSEAAQRAEEVVHLLPLAERLRQLDQKIAYAAKVLALRLVERAHNLLDGEPAPTEPAAVERLSNAVGELVEVARLCDSLGDRGMVRADVQG